MKLLWVTSDDDYAALTFESSKYNNKDDLRRFWDEAKENGETTLTIIDDDDPECYTDVYMKALEFGVVDPKFIDWVRYELQDYDDSKHRNFFIVEE